MRKKYSLGQKTWRSIDWLDFVFHISILIQEKFLMRLFEKWLFLRKYFSQQEKLFVAYTKKSLKARRGMCSGLGGMAGGGVVAILYDKLYEGIFFRASFDYRHYLHFIHSHTFSKIYWCTLGKKSTSRLVFFPQSWTSQKTFQWSLKRTLSCQSILFKCSNRKSK